MVEWGGIWREGMNDGFDENTLYTSMKFQKELIMTKKYFLRNSTNMDKHIIILKIIL